MSTIRIPKEQARRFLIGRQRYKAYGRGFVGAQGVRDAIRHLGAVQVDPINVFERNHHQALFCRVHNYQQAMLNRTLYEDNLAFEYYCNALCVLPIEDFPYFRYAMRQRAMISEISSHLREAMQDVLKCISEQGAVTSRQFDSGQRVRGWWDAEERTKIEKQALDYLHLYGQILISGREGSQRHYSLPEALLPKQYLAENIDEQEYRNFMLRKFLTAYGLNQASLFRFGWFDGPKAEKRSLLQGMVERGEVREVQIEGIHRTYYCPASLLPELLAAEEPLAPASSAVLLPPLDNLLWDRDRLAELFDFDYRWEVYTPASKRKYGYYVIPVLFGEQFVGRIELRAIREECMLSIGNLWLDSQTSAVREAITEAVHEEADYLRLAVRWNCEI